MKAISRVLLATIVILGAHASLVAVTAPAEIRSRPEHQWMANAFAAEDYLSGGNLPPCVIVGSSMAARIRAAFLSVPIYNLAFGGGSTRTGLALIRESGTIPAVLIVETNIIQRSLDAAFVADMTHSWGRVVPSFRERARPTVLFQKFVGRTLAGYARRSYEILFSLIAGALPSPVAAHVRQEEPPPGAQDVEDPVTFDRGQVLAGVEAAVEELRAAEAAGSRLVFLELPVRADKRESAAPRYVREQLMRHFPEGEYLWLMPSVPGLRTTDGVHLNPTEARSVAAEISRTLQSLELCERR